MEFFAWLVCDSDVYYFAIDILIYFSQLYTMASFFCLICAYLS